MSHIPSSIKLTLCLLLLLTANACRKKIFVPASETTTSSTDKYAEWTKFLPTYSNVRKLHVYANNLYLTALQGQGKTTVAMLSAPNNYYKITDYYSNTDVMDLEVYNGKLFLGGRIYASLNAAPMILASTSLNPPSGTSGYFTQTNTAVSGMEIFQGKLYFCGNFQIGSGVSHNYIGSMLNNSKDNSMGALYSAANGLHASSSELYVYGSRVADATNYSGIARMSGASWIPVTYGGNDKYKNVKSMVLSSGSFFFSYIEQGVEGLKIGSVSNGYYQSVPEIVLTKDAVANFKVVDGKVYLFGQGISLNGKATNVLFRQDDGTWAYNKIISETVNDIALYNNKLYAATSGGLYYE